VRARTGYTDFPDAFFESIHRLLTPSGTARFYIGWYKDEPLASGLFLCTAETMLYYLGGSTRDRQLTAKQAPAAVFWHAIREARRLGMTRFDFGGCTPTDDPADPRHGVYDFKKRWGGRLETFANLEVVLSPAAVSFQEHVLSPLWDRLHPLYFRLRMLRGARA
jgi:lipid II:glycine glycyltransferase (peptidoglycan interpeptide bridge formation enzyme)